MANRRLTPEKALVAGLTTTILSDILTADTHQVRNNGRVFLRIVKGGAGNAVLTFITPGNVGGYAITDPTATVVATTGIMIIGPFPPAIFNNSNGDLEWTVDDVVGLTCEVVQL